MPTINLKIYLSNYTAIVYFKSLPFRNLGLAMKLWRKETLTLVAVTVIHVCCGGAALTGDKFSIYREERFFKGRFSEQ